MKHYTHLPSLPKATASRTLLRDITAPIFSEGCYLLRFQTKKAATILDGTLRFDHEGSTLLASGDLYKRTIVPNPSNGIPIFPRKAYSNYWRVVEIVPTENGMLLNIESYIFRSSKGGSWQYEGIFSVNMHRQNAPEGFAKTADYAEGDVMDTAQKMVGRLSIGWVSPFFRQATIEIDTVEGSEAPLSTSDGKDWKMVFGDCNWDVKATLNSQNTPEKSGNSWSNAELHAALHAHREQVNLDTEWRFHIMAVKNLDATERGIMYDVGATDSNKISREGIGIATHWQIPNEPQWGLVQGKRSGEAKDVLFRTAVHEIGHALGLQHNFRDNGFMNATNTIAASATADVPFPKNIKWAFADADKRRLRHFPDIYVRPGGTAFGASMNKLATTGSFDEADIPTEGVSFTIEPVLTHIPLGVPVRLELALHNTSPYDQLLPADISLKSGFLRGKVTDAWGEERVFSSLIVCMDAEELSVLPSGEKRLSSLTLLRGAQGALFPSAGSYDISIDIHWHDKETEGFATATTRVHVQSSESVEQAKVVQKLLATPDLLLTLVLGGDHLRTGISALKKALAQPALRTHFAFLEARRLSQKKKNRARNLKKAAQLLAENPVMSLCEKIKAQQFLKEK
jgi:predicted Zn-dependent protease